MDFETSAGSAAAPAFETQTPGSTDEAPIAKKANPDLDALLAALEHQRIAAVAYFFWQQRGCPHGSSEEDWFQAKQHIRESQ